ncbi:uncharacterized protein EHS24_003817 [Apiotrichum porosum]|uniref:Uncharacterized protein n=1 Tax=Apiotrichum porosum TaxID=105984 RepID=A0A427XDU7_9TREE|nr:uncharacterized protein EHS24_003817 [Apiotrichum porosum]RSH76884.1 hypothetical protein EHS24_003817 [Apiotrichum porosum]
MNHPSRLIPDSGAQYEKFLFTAWPGVHSMWTGDNKEWEVDRCQKVIGEMETVMKFRLPRSSKGYAWPYDASLFKTGTKWGIPEIYAQGTAWVKQAHSMCGEPIGTTPDANLNPYTMYLLAAIWAIIGQGPLPPHRPDPLQRSELTFNFRNPNYTMATGFTSPTPRYARPFQFPGDNFAAGSDFHTVFNPLPYSNNRGLVPKGPFRDPLERQNEIFEAYSQKRHMAKMTM